MEEDNFIVFEWRDWGLATASLTGDSMSVRYNGLMQMSDFEDGVYILER